MKHLGKSTTIGDGPRIDILDAIENPHPNTDYQITLSSDEFTTLCPITKQPDFASINIQYTPKDFILESKSFKLYLYSFRNVGMFHEDCTVRIAKEIYLAIKPEKLTIKGSWSIRGGISIKIDFTL